MAIGACCTRLRARVVRTKSDVARATRSRPVNSAARRRRSRALPRHPRGRREGCAHLLPVAGERHGDRTSDGDRQADERELRRAPVRLATLTPRMQLEQRGEPGNRRRNTWPVAVGTIMKQSTALRNTNCSNEPAVAAMCALTSEHEHSSDDDERAEDEDRSTNRARQMSREVPKNVSVGRPGHEGERQARRRVDRERRSEEKRRECRELRADDRCAVVAAADRAPSRRACRTRACPR